MQRLHILSGMSKYQRELELAHVFKTKANLQRKRRIFEEIAQPISKTSVQVQKFYSNLKSRTIRKERDQALSGNSLSDDISIYGRADENDELRAHYNSFE